MLLSFCHFAVAADHIHYIVTLQNPEKHLVQVELEVPAGRSERELQLPVWNALYQVRDFSQYMNWIRAEAPNGRTLLLAELNKSRWKISGAENGARVQYELYADNPGPYGAQLNSQHAFFNLAEILCYIEGEQGTADEVEFRSIPSPWKIATPLNQHGNTFVAKNYDEMVDSPVEISAFQENDFDGQCGKYRVVVDAADSAAILTKIVPPIQRIVSTETEWMHDCPFHQYTFVYHFADAPGDGGMEHSFGTAITLPTSYISEDFERFESVTAHEFFHLWNVKRIRPQSLEPIDYTKENYTPALWFSEGVDSTVAGYIEVRAGLLDEQGYLEHVGREITELQNRPAHLAQSAEQSSIDAWLEKYPYYNLPERSISYYNKGELLGILLDLKMREASDDQVSLQTLFRWMNEHYAKQGKFFPDSQGVSQAAETLTHSDFAEFFRKYVSGTEEIPWDEFFQRVGLKTTTTVIISADPGFKATRIFDQPLTVLEVEQGSGAERAGIKSGDVILEINGRPAGRSLERALAQLSPGTPLRLRVLRGGVQRDLEWVPATRQQQVFRLEDMPGITEQQRSRRAAWLFGSSKANSGSTP
jgi:predicted metalloprotease with PDZ domain